MTLQDWFAGPLGRRLLHEEKRLLQTLLPPLFGYHVLQLGGMGDVQWLEASRIKHRCILNTAPGKADVRVHAEALPIASDSVDVVVLGHVLEFAEHPHAVLREVERVLIPEGHLILLAFNPFSLWGLRRLLPGSAPPWHGRFRSALRIKDWLALLGLELVGQHSVYFAPPLHNVFLLRRLRFLEPFGRRWWPHWGGAYVLVARKRVATLTPIKPSWTGTQKVLAAVRPTVRRDRHDRN